MNVIFDFITNHSRYHSGGSIAEDLNNSPPKLKALNLYTKEGYSHQNSQDCCTKNELHKDNINSQHFFLNYEIRIYAS